VSAHPPFLTASILSQHKAIQHGFFGAQGGVSTGKYKSLNCGELSHDDSEKVRTNRGRVAGVFSLGAEFLISCKQVHSTRVLTITEGLELNAPFEGDGLVTNQSGIAISALGADCAPVLFYDPVNQIIGAAHSGWKGALNGINERVIQNMCALGSDVSEIVVAIGPAMAVTHYEVGEEFVTGFLNNGVIDSENCFERRKEGIYFDLTRFIRLRLKAAGIVHQEQIEQDTYTQASKYFSYRRSRSLGEGDYGRQIAAISLR
jgi:YfiH family protein